MRDFAKLLHGVMQSAVISLFLSMICVVSGKPANASHVQAGEVAFVVWTVLAMENLSFGNGLW